MRHNAHLKTVHSDDEKIMTEKRFSNVVGFDDAPFPREHRGNVKLVGTVYAGNRFDGVLIGEIEKDGFDSAQQLIELIAESRFKDHIQLIMLQGITFGGFNVVDVFAVNKKLGLPLLIVSRKPPDMPAIQKALLMHIGDGEKKWEVIDRLGDMLPAGGVFIQHVGLSRDHATAVLNQFSVHGNIPEPLRSAHLIAGALAHGQSRGRT